jgi:hypothetical protein
MSDTFDTLNAKLFTMNQLCGLLQRKNKVLKEEIVILRARKNFRKKQANALREAWLELRQRELRAGGMKIEQARLHARSQLDGTIKQ